MIIAAHYRYTAMTVSAGAEVRLRKNDPSVSLTADSSLYAREPRRALQQCGSLPVLPVLSGRDTAIAVSAGAEKRI